MSGINGIFSTALSGLNAAGAVINTAASNIAKFDTTASNALEDVDLPSELVNLKLGGILYNANAAVVRVADQMTGTLLDMFDSDHHQHS